MTSFGGKLHRSVLSHTHKKANMVFNALKWLGVLLKHVMAHVCFKWCSFHPVYKLFNPLIMSHWPEIIPLNYMKDDFKMNRLSCAIPRKTARTWMTCKDYCSLSTFVLNLWLMKWQSMQSVCSAKKKTVSVLVSWLWQCDYLDIHRPIIKMGSA